MPFAVVGAIASIGFAAADVAAVGLTLSTAFEVVGAVGATLGAIGVVTRDKGLQTAGLILGGMGGIGALGAAAGVFGADASTASLFGSSSDASAASGGAATTAGNVAQGGTDQLGGQAATAAGGQTDIVDNLGGVSPVNPAASVDQSVAGASGTESAAIANPVTGQLSVPNLDVGSSTDTSALGTTGAGGAADSGVAGGATGAGNALPGLPTGAPAAPGVVAPAPPGTFTDTLPTSESLGTGFGNPSGVLTGQAGVPTAPGSTTGLGSLGVAPGGSSGTFGDIADFAKNNQLVTYGVLQAGGSFLAGATNPLTPAQKAALDAQAAANNASAALTKLQVANLSQGIPQASPVPANVTGRPAGLINSAAPAGG